ncbi:hypothetical protein SEVIR_2G069900v4 [Setaria viridis]|uniref:FBD domain-containing protein n=2 Tax=Setaria viridis TaxID=4556 RepID=A0A4U6VPT2_SETVI|nr:uncharacterized protein LOC117843191 [Setaria viridis]TKW30915.1 hypothetical protein SEVIR_2G069900v2 [Setaria viridis]
MLRKLSVSSCFMVGKPRQPVADISAPVLEMLLWADTYDDMSSVQLGELPQLRKLRIFCGLNSYYYPYNLDPVMLLRRFQKIPILIISPTNVMDPQHLAKVTTLLPDIEELRLSVGLLTTGHTFGPFVFHLLRIFSSIRKLKLKISEETKAKTIWLSGCVCRQPQNWKTEELYSNSLQEVKICQLTGSERELTFLKLLLKWTEALKTITLVLDPSVTVSDQICQELLGHYSRPEICMKIYLYRNGSKVMYEPVG